ncbi:MAG: acetoacetate--CoA ligase [Devosia sp.]|uniref:acetoacetate--CoA ligase n=1 Tax=unclassified Devosia TaxID=196773 RepID=UPI0019D86198|nr:MULTISPECIES: acetoacetate--CoA ligase [unclassified Devosia]MBF0677710.1 acetoacetate--CoA ligase [Devosia sp.]WEJ34235.1 acetoacetate--CoA ligase [Devosia sp. SD17-2]
MNDILFQPGPERIAAAALAGFAKQQGFTPTDYASLHRWSVEQPDAYHSALWAQFDIVGERGARVYLPGSSIRDMRFFPDARLNYAENLLRQPDGRMAIIAHREDGTRRTLTRAELFGLVSRLVQAMRAEGVGMRDRVAGIVTNDIEAIALYLATSAIGAIWASCSPDFGPAAAADRLGQVEPALLVAVPRYDYGGKQFDTTASINAVCAAGMPRRLVLLGEASDLSGYHGPAVTLDDWIAPYAEDEIDFVRQGFDAPHAVLFSSGTTGKPKGIVHGAGRLLLQHLKEQQLHCDLRAGDRFFYYTTCGWMMWNWLVSGLASGATLVTFDGNPAYPHMGRLADIIDEDEIDIFGTSAKYIDACNKARLRPKDTHRLSRLRTILSTGSPLLPDGYDHIYRDWKSDVHLASISGGTDICACFLGGVPTLPVRRGEMQGAMLGMDVHGFDQNGAPVSEGAGELVCRNAHLSMPVGFWNDASGARYRAAYFERFEGVWTHGDFVERRPSGGYVIHGRSDATLNPGGIRIGTAEIYRQVEPIPQILEAIAVGQEWQGDQRIILFVRLEDGAVLDDALVSEIRKRIRSGATPRHVPAKILAVPDIPRTRSNKIAELSVRDAVNGKAMEDNPGLANPEALSHFRDRQELLD